MPRIARVCLVVDLLLLAATAPMYAVTGLSVSWRTVVPHAALLLVFGGLWAYLRATAKDDREQPIIDTVLATTLVVLVTNIASPGQYLALMTQRPLVDPVLARADAALGIDVAQLAGWTRGQPIVSRLLAIAYFSLLPQFVLALLALGLYYRSRERLWEYVFNFHFCAVFTVVALAAFPAECAFQYMDFRSTIDQTRFVAHFNGYRDGSLSVIRFDDVEGLVSFPSFHAAGAMMVTWAFRGRPAALLVLAPINALLLLATVFSGAHYVVDLVATAGLFTVSVWVSGLVSRGARSGVWRAAARTGPVSDGRWGEDSIG